MRNNKPLLHSQGYRSIGRRHRGTWLLGFFKQLDFGAHLFLYLALLSSSLEHVGYSFLLQKILRMICLNWIPPKPIVETIVNCTFDFVVQSNCIQIWKSWVPWKSSYLQRVQNFGQIATWWHTLQKPTNIGNWPFGSDYFMRKYSESSHC